MLYACPKLDDVNRVIQIHTCQFRGCFCLILTKQVSKYVSVHISNTTPLFHIPRANPLEAYQHQYLLITSLFEFVLSFPFSGLNIFLSASSNNDCTIKTIKSAKCQKSRHQLAYWSGYIHSHFQPCKHQLYISTLYY